MSNGHHIPEEDLALYAMGSLHAGEASSAREHLRDCPECRKRLSEVTEELALLALTAEQQTLPAGARQRFVARVANTPQRGAAPVPVVPQAEVPSRLIEPEPERRSFWPVLVPWVLTAAAVALAGYLGLNNQRLRQTLGENQGQIARLSADADRARQIVDTLTSPSATHVTLAEGKASAQPSGHVTYLPSKGSLILIANHLHAIPANKAYELWVIPANGKAPIPAGTFRPDTNGSASVVLPQIPQDVPAKAFGVTIERAEGSPTPTLPIVLAGQ